MDAALTSCSLGVTRATYDLVKALASIPLLRTLTSCNCTNGEFAESVVLRSTCCVLVVGNGRVQHQRYLLGIRS